MVAKLMLEIVGSASKDLLLLPSIDQERARPSRGFQLLLRLLQQPNHLLALGFLSLIRATNPLELKAASLGLCS
jgi:hypothetical protein